MLEEFKKILGELYVKHGLTDEIIRLSQAIDILVNKEMKIGEKHAN